MQFLDLGGVTQKGASSKHMTMYMYMYKLTPKLPKHLTVVCVGLPKYTFRSMLSNPGAGGNVDGTVKVNARGPFCETAFSVLGHPIETCVEELTGFNEMTSMNLDL